MIRPSVSWTLCCLLAIRCSIAQYPPRGDLPACLPTADHALSFVGLAGGRLGEAGGGGVEEWSTALIFACACCAVCSLTKAEGVAGNRERGQVKPPDVRKGGQGTGEAKGADRRWLQGAVVLLTSTPARCSGAPVPRHGDNQQLQDGAGLQPVGVSLPEGGAAPPSARPAEIPCRLSLPAMSAGGRAARAACRCRKRAGGGSR